MAAPIIFISYTAADLEQVETLQKNLEAKGVDIWQQPEVFVGGNTEPKTLGDLIRSSDVFLLCWSRHAREAQIPRLELRAALELKTPIIPYVLDATPIPEEISSLATVHSMEELLATIDRQAISSGDDSMVRSGSGEVGVDIEESPDVVSAHKPGAVEHIISDSDLPALFKKADSVSQEGQRWYLRLTRINLTVLILGAIFASFSFTNVGYHKLALTLSAVFLAVSIVLTLILSGKTYKKLWYGGRAAAESAKTLAWRYMMQAEPFDRDGEEEAIDRRLTDGLRDIIQGSTDLSLADSRGLESEFQITEAMRHLREADLKTRKRAYVTSRVRDQQNWYAGKAVFNAKREKKWFWIVALAQLLALATAILIINLPDFFINPTGVFSTIAASALAWLQVKQHEELAQSYSVASHELSLIADMARYATDEDRFSAFVTDAETAISREHTLWLARRDQQLTLDFSNIITRPRS